MKGVTMKKSKASISATRRWTKTTPKQRATIREKKVAALRAYNESLTDEERAAQAKKKSAGQKRRWREMPKAKRKRIGKAISAGKRGDK